MWICRRWTEYKRRASGWIHVFYQAKIPVRMRTSAFAKRGYGRFRWQQASSINTITELVQSSENWNIQTATCLSSGLRYTNLRGIYIKQLVKRKNAGFIFK